MSAFFLIALPSTIWGMCTYLTQRFQRWQTQLGAVSRQLLATLAFSAAGLVGLAVSEGYTAKAVPDPVKGTTVPTIGFGTSR